jgi:hypothetical protein
VRLRLTLEGRVSSNFWSEALPMCACCRVTETCQCIRFGGYLRMCSPTNTKYGESPERVKLREDSDQEWQAEKEENRISYTLARHGLLVMASRHKDILLFYERLESGILQVPRMDSCRN